MGALAEEGKEYSNVEAVDIIHQVANLYLDVRVGQHRDIGGGHQKKQELATVGGKPVSGEILNPHEFLGRTAFLLFAHLITSNRRFAGWK